MTGSQLRALRGKRTREEFAQFLGDCSASTVNNWERSISPVPQWVAEKALRGVSVEIELGDLQDLLDHAREEGTPFRHVLAQAIREYMAKRRGKVVDHRAIAGTMLIDEPEKYNAPPHAKPPSKRKAG